ncbi:MAG TPA: NUDIX domain-containing protein [Candidatus Saccharimonadia bacterium]|nr:NUDIX domain-containing protein [Candidatus Saccharimonadia bacterium]
MVKPTAIDYEQMAPDAVRRHKGKSFPGVTTVFLCHDGQGHFFMAKRSKNCRDEQGRWDIGGGGLKWGQRAKDNALREIQEEYGATPQSIEFIGYRDAFRKLEDGTPTHWLAMDFVAKVDPATVSIREPDTFDDSGWFMLDTLPSPLHSQLELEYFDKYREQLKKFGIT